MNMIKTKIMLLFIFALLVIITLVMCFSIKREEHLLDKINMTNQGLLLYYSGTIEKELKTAEMFLVEQRLNQSNYLSAERASSELDLYLDTNKIKNIFEYALYEMDFMDSFFFYMPENVDFKAKAGDTVKLNGEAFDSDRIVELPVEGNGFEASFTVPEDAVSGDVFVVNLEVQDEAERPMTRFAQYVIVVE